VRLERPVDRHCVAGRPRQPGSGLPDRDRAEDALVAVVLDQSSTDAGCDAALDAIRARIATSTALRRYEPA
jgi:hypothetical protein